MRFALHVLYIFSFIAFHIDTSIALRCWECFNARSNEACLRNGRITTCKSNQNVCEDHVRYSNFGKYKSFDKRCKQAQACRNNLEQSSLKTTPFQCSKESQASVCRCCCSSDQCNMDLDTCIKDIPKLHVKCNAYPPAPEKGNRQCNGNLRVGSNCTYSCHDGYHLDGPRRLQCLEGGKWNGKSPTCKIAACTPMRSTIPYGTVFCDHGSSLNSLCTFSCNRGYMILGDKFLSCKNHGTGLHRSWSSNVPRCVPMPRCKPLERSWGLRTSCNGANVPGTSCSFSCNLGFNLIGAKRIICKSSLQWSKAAPTCSPVRCFPSYDEFLNGAVSCTNDNMVRSSCRFTCNYGYEIKGVYSTSCRNNWWGRMGRGTWTNTSPSCKEKRCRTIYAPERGSINCTGEQQFKEECYFSCDEGHDLIGEELLYCEGDGTWNWETPICKARLCEQTLVRDPNMDMACTEDNKYGSVCTFACRGRYNLVGSATTTCGFSVVGSDSELDWSTKAPTCFVGECKYLKEVRNGKKDCTETYAVGVGSCTYSCNDGYFLAGPTTITCGDGGDWSNLPPRCMEIRCPVLSNGLPLNIMRTCTKANLHGSQCNYTCIDKYEILGDSVTYCIEDPAIEGAGVWTANQPTCELTDLYCPPLVINENSNKFCTTENDKVGSECLVECDEGFYSVGVSTIYCVMPPMYGGTDGVWETFAPKCEPITCLPLPKIFINGNTSCTAGQAWLSTCRYECNDRYELVGTTELTCLQGAYDTSIGVWDGLVPYCTALFCTALTAPEHSTMTCTNPHNDFGTECTVTCDEGYYLEGIETTTCDERRVMWTSRLPTCMPVQCFDELTSPANGKKTCSDGTNLGSICSFTCNENYRLDGYDVTFCIENPFGGMFGYWDQSQPTCEEITCPTLTPPENAGLECSSAVNTGSYSSGAHSVGESCTIKCVGGHVLNGAPTLTCENLSDTIGLWSHPLPSCDSVPCPLLEEFSEGGERICDGSTCAYVCYENYRLNGSSLIECKGSASLPGIQVWDYQQPVCEEILCEQLEVPANSAVYCLNTEGNLISGTQCDVLCEFGYFPNGAETVTCGNDGEVGLWNDELATCERIVCEAPPPMENGTWECSDSNNMYSECTLVCDESYKVGGINEISCNEEGENPSVRNWSENQALCILV